MAKKIEEDLVIFLNGFQVLQPYSGTIAITIIVVTLTFCTLVLGELVPKRIGLTMPEKISKSLAYPMYWVFPHKRSVHLVAHLHFRHHHQSISNTSISKKQNHRKEEIKAFIKKEQKAAQLKKLNRTSWNGYSTWATEK